MIDAVKSYLQMASGLVEASAAKAMEAAQGLVSSGLESGTKAHEQMATHVATSAEDRVSAARSPSPVPSTEAVSDAFAARVALDVAHLALVAAVRELDEVEDAVISSLERLDAARKGVGLAADLVAAGCRRVAELAP